MTEGRKESTESRARPAGNAASGASEAGRAEIEDLYAALSAARARLQATIDSSLDAIVSTDVESRIIEWSHHAETMFGWPKAEALGRTLSETIIPPRYREAHNLGVERYLATGEGPILNRRIEITALRRDGREFPVELAVAPAAWGEQTVFNAFIRDLTEAKRQQAQRDAEHAVTRVLAESRTLAEAAPRVLEVMGEALGWAFGAFWVPAEEAGVLRSYAIWEAPDARVQGFAEATRGATFEPGVGLPGRIWQSRAPEWISDVGTDGNFPRAARAADVGLHGAFGFPIVSGERVLGVIEYLHPDVLEPDDALLRTLEVIGHDLAQAMQRVEAEAERDRALASMREIATTRDAVLKQIADGVIFADPDGTIVFINEAAREIHGTAKLGVKPEAYSESYGILKMSGEPFAREEAPLARAVLRGETVIDAEWRVRRPDGGEAIARGSATPVVGADGQQIGAVLTLRDVTEEKKLRRELELERERLREIFMHAPALIAVTRGPEHRIVLANPAYQRTVGGRELVGRTIREALPELEGQGFFQMRDRVYESGEPHVQNEARVLADLDGDGEVEESLINFVTQPLFEDDGTVGGILTFGVDVTEQVRARRLMEEQAAELEAHAEELQSQAMALEEAQAELEMTNAELQRANEDLLAKSREAEHARALADEANRAKSEFLANMSHELRTPMNAILGYADLLETEVTGSVTDAQRKQLERISASGKHLLMLIEDILDLSKISASRVEVAREPTKTGEAVDAAISLIEPQAADRGIAIEHHCHEEDLVFVGDDDRVRQILANLLSNAVKFTEPSGKVVVSCDTTDDAEGSPQLATDGPWVRIDVEDTGIGIPEDRLDFIFEPFTQVESGSTRTKGGTGLGLAISRELARLMDGDLTVESRIGEGSRFTLWLPAA